MIRPKGFTLAETLLVFFLIGTFLLLPVLRFERWQLRLEEARFFAAFEKRVLLLQQIAVATHKNTTIDLNGAEGLIVFRQGDIRYSWGELIAPASITVISSGSYRFKGGTGGFGDQVKAAVFRSGAGKTTYQFQIGAGRYTKTITP